VTKGEVIQHWHDKRSRLMVGQGEALEKFHLSVIELVRTEDALKKAWELPEDERSYTLQAELEPEMKKVDKGGQHGAHMDVSGTEETFIQEPKMEVERGNVVRELTTGAKRCIFSRETLDIAKWELVSESPHEDDDFSYLCHRDFCRCSQ